MVMPRTPFKVPTSMQATQAELTDQQARVETFESDKQQSDLQAAALASQVANMQIDFGKLKHVQMQAQSVMHLQPSWNTRGCHGRF